MKCGVGRQRALDDDRALGADELEADAGHQREVPGDGDRPLALGKLRLGHRPAVRPAGEGPGAGLDGGEEHGPPRQHRLGVGRAGARRRGPASAATIPGRP